METTEALLFAALFVGLQIADIWTTWAVLARGGRELNPLMAWLMRLFGFWPAVVGAKALAIAAVLVWLDEMAAWELAVIIGAYVAVVGSNLRALRRLRTAAPRP